MSYELNKDLLETMENLYGENAKGFVIDCSFLKNLLVKIFQS